MLLSLLTVCLLLTLSVDTRVSGTCPPCPAPPVTACCKAGDQVLGTCCQPDEKCCFPVDDDLPPYCSASDKCEY